MRNFLLPWILLAGLVGRGQEITVLNVIPRPVSAAIFTGSFVLSDSTTIIFDHTDKEAPLKNEVEALGIGLARITALPSTVMSKPHVGKNSIHLRIGASVPEGYDLTVTPDRIDIIGNDAQGVLHGVMTLLRVVEDRKPPYAFKPVEIPCMNVKDQPRFPWRGMHLDVCRHFFPVDFVKKYIDLLARYKMNTFHWHLTDDQGWRIEIKKHPKLTETASWRKGSQYGPYSQRTYDNEPYGGFYTQEQIREVVAYARARHITVVPEIEMPGHALAALAAYPELSCTGGPFEVQKGWGVFDDVFCPKDETFSFLQDVLTEVIDLFPGEYIHIGGDECPKERWKTCVHCQALMKKEGLKDEHELQSYFIQRIEKFVNSKGRKIIGWDEILEGGLAPNAAVMSWRGTEGGMAAAKQKHNAVMCPGSHCYLDHYQGDPASEPLAIGGFTTVQKTYSYDPIPAGLSAEEAKYILGAQGNVWTEYIATPEHVEYMALPRMMALAEALWTPLKLKDERSFISRLEPELDRLTAMGVNASRSVYNVGFKLSGSKKRGQVNIDLKGPAGLGEVRYTLDGTEPTPTSALFTSTIELQASGNARAALFRDGRKLGNSTLREFKFNMATGQAITIQPQPNERYNDGGAFALVDGVTAGNKRVNHEWLGWKDDKITVTVDLGSEQFITRSTISALDEKHSWIHAPTRVDIAYGITGMDYVDILSPIVPTGATGHVAYTANEPRMARYVRFTVHAVQRIPEGHAGAGSTPWTFLDEIVIQ